MNKAITKTLFHIYFILLYLYFITLLQNKWTDYKAFRNSSCMDQCVIPSILYYNMTFYISSQTPVAVQKIFLADT
jgi:hypothetical protein